MKFSLSVLLASCLSATAVAGDGPAILPLDEVVKGMKGVGRTVFEGNRVEEFDVEVLGVLRNSAPRRSTILARLDGGPLAKAGVIAGMSGSPVYIDGRLVGAVSSGYLYSKEPIAGITPIEEMLAIPLRDRSPARGDALYRSSGAEIVEILGRLERFELVDGDSALDRLQARAPGFATGVGSVPVVLSGLAGPVYERAASLLSSFGLVPMQGSGVARSTESIDGELGPGSPIAVELVRGDLNMAAHGTVTARNGDSLLAFGHPLFNLGSVRFPIAESEVVTVLPSVYNSFKISSIGRTVGALSQDRAAGVSGKLGASAPMIPVQIGLQHGANPVDSFSFELGSHRLLSPALVEIVLLNTLYVTEKLVGSTTLRVRGRLGVSGHEEVVLDLFVSGDQAVSQTANFVSLVASLILNNPFEKVDLTGLTLVVDYLEDNRFAVVKRVWADRVEVDPGETIEIKASLSRVRGDDITIPISVRVPEDTPAGPIDLIVGDASSIARLEALTQRYTPKSLGQVIDMLNEMRSSSSLYALLSRKDAGLAVAGAKLSRLPPSAYNLLVHGRNAETLQPIRRATFAEAAQATDLMLGGFKLLKLKVTETRQ